MKYIIFALLIMASILIFAACSSRTGKQETSSGTKHEEISTESTPASSVIKPDEAKARLDNEEGIILLDVRTLEEYSQQHIPESLLIPLDELKQKASEQLLDKDAVVFVYCRSGRRSAQAAKILVEQGYTKVHDLGGIIDWPYETEP